MLFERARNCFIYISLNNDAVITSRFMVFHEGRARSLRHKALISERDLEPAGETERFHRRGSLITPTQRTRAAVILILIFTMREQRRRLWRIFCFSALN